MFVVTANDQTKHLHGLIIGKVLRSESIQQGAHAVAEVMSAEHNALYTWSEDWMSSQLNQAVHAVLCEHEAAMGESLLSEGFSRHVVQSLAGETEVWQVFWVDRVGYG